MINGDLEGLGGLEKCFLDFFEFYLRIVSEIEVGEDRFRFFLDVFSKYIFRVVECGVGYFYE